MRYYTISDIAKKLSINEETVRRWVRSGKLTGTRMSKKGGFKVSEFDFTNFLTEHPKYIRRYEGVLERDVIEAYMSARNELKVQLKLLLDEKSELEKRIAEIQELLKYTR